MMRMLIAATALFVASPAWGWGYDAHRLIADMAVSETRPQTRAAIARLLARHRDVATPDCPIDSVAGASVWADCVRRLGPRFSYQSPWHYQNVSVCAAYDTATACRDGNCVQDQVTRAARLLADEAVPDRERLIALANLIHFTADLHQPVHAGDDGDRGGNDVPTRYGIVDQGLNLHRIWDSVITERAVTTPPAGGDALLAAIPVEARPAVAAGTPEDWARESWAAARDVAYAGARGGDPCARDRPAALDEPAIAAGIAVIRRQIAHAAIRLTRLLDEALG